MRVPGILQVWKSVFTTIRLSFGPWSDPPSRLIRYATRLG
jgi:hypothetical protein